MRTFHVMRNLTGVSALTLMIIGIAAPASAQSQSANLSVGATVTNNCTISATAVSFSAYDPVVANASANLDGDGRVTVACTKGASPSIALGLGSNASGSARRLAAGTERLTYELYQDSNRSTVWNTTTGVYTPVAATSKAPRDFTVYGRIASGQDVAAGTYSDTIVATVNF